jgi:hypothetical protein
MVKQLRQLREKAESDSFIDIEGVKTKYDTQIKNAVG